MNKGLPSLPAFLYFLFDFHPILFFLLNIFHSKFSQLIPLLELNETNDQFSTIKWDTKANSN